MKPITAFTPYNLSTPKLAEWCAKAAKSQKTADVIKFFLAKDPAAHEWNSHGLTAPIDEGQVVHSLDGAANLLCYQFNDRILPAAVRDEKILARVRAIEEKEGREVTTKEWAQTRDEVENELLPQAFIRRSYVPVLVYAERLFICTTSAKKCETIIGHLQSLMNVRKIDCELWNIWTEKEVGKVLKEAVLGENLVADSDNHFWAGDAAVFKGSDKRTMRIKDRDVTQDEVTNAMVQGSYAVTELRLDWYAEDDTPMASVMLTDKLIFKGIKMGEAIELKTAEDTHATFFIYAKQLEILYCDVIDVLGGESEQAPEMRDDDEL